MISKKYTLTQRSSYFKKDGTKIIEREYSCGLKTREVDCSEAQWYKKLIELKTKPKNYEKKTKTK